MQEKSDRFVVLVLIHLLFFAFNTSLFSQDVTIGPVGALGGTVRCGIVHNNHAYYSQGLSIRIVDVSDPEQPQSLGKLLVQGLAVDIAAQGSSLYVLFAGDSLVAYDITNPASPVKTGSCSAWGGIDGQIVLAANTAYILGYVYMDIVSLANPAAPVNAGSTDIQADEAFAVGNRLYTIFRDENQIRVYDIINATQPALLDSAKTREYIEDIFVRDNLAYLGSAAYPGGLQILDVSDVQDMHELGYVETTFSAERLTLLGQYVMLGNGWLNVVDASDPVNPAEMGNFESGGSIRDIVGIGDFVCLFVGDTETGFQIVDVSDPDLPSKTFDSSPEPFDVQHVRCLNDTLFIADNASNLWTFLTPDPANPTFQSRIELDGTPDLMSIQDGKMFQVLWATSFSVYDLSDPGTPVLETTYEAGQNISGYFVQENLLYLLKQEWDGSNPVLELVDISTPGDPQQISVTDLPGEGRAIQVSGSTVYVAHAPSGAGDGLLVLDTSDQEDPQLLGTGAVTGKPMCMARISNTIFIGSNSESGTVQWRIQQFDVTDPGAPVLSENIAQSSNSGNIQEIWEMTVQGGLLFAGVRGGSAHVYDTDLRLLARCPSYGTIGIAVTPINGFETGWVFTPEGEGSTDDRYKQGSEGVVIQKVEVKPSSLKLTVSGSKARQAMCPDSALKKPVLVLPIVLKASIEDSWRVTKINFQAAGSGQEGMDIREVEILWGSQTVFKGSYPPTSEKLAADLNPNVIVPAGQQIVLQMFYDFSYNDSTYAIDTTFTFTVKTGVVVASPETKPGGDIEGLAQRDTLTIARIINSANYGFSKIQKAVNSARTPSGATVFVCYGTYEEHVEIRKSLTLRSMHSREVTTLTYGSNSILELYTNDIFVRDFTFQNTGPNMGGNIHIRGKEASRCSILDNIITGADFGVHLAGASECQVMRNIISKTDEGIELSAGATANHIGGQGVNKRNVLIKNSCGILIRGEKTDANQIVGNFIGIDSSGSYTSANSTGIRITVDRHILTTDSVGPAVNVIRSNVIAGNNYNGVEISGGCYWNEISGNYIGTNQSSETYLRNLGHGILLESGAEQNIIGGSKPEDGNKIWSNQKNGIELSGQATKKNQIIGNSIIGNSEGIVISWESHDNTIAGNIVSANKKNGILIKNAYGNDVRGNLIGVTRTEDGSMMYKFANQENGILITSGAKRNIIGLIKNKDRNIISGNDKNGIEICGAGSNENQVNSNLIGTDDTGNKALKNESQGVYCHSGAGSNSIQGAVISGNRENGILIDNAPRTLVEGAYIGTDDKVTTLVPNEKAGIAIKDASFCTILNNFICGNKEEGIVVYGKTQYAQHNEITNNFIGSDNNNNPLPNGGYGVAIYPRSKYTRVNGNKIGFNQGGIDDFGTKSQILNNLLANNKGSTGIHLTGANPQVRGNEIRGDETDGIYCEQGANPVIFKNNFRDNAGFGLNNVDASVSILAQDNWWGDAEGAEGGQGDGVSGSVDATNWKTQPVSVVVSFSFDTLNIAPGKTDSVICHFQNWENQTDLLDVEISDAGGWISGEIAQSIQLRESIGEALSIPITIPPAVAAGSQGAIKIKARSSINIDQADSDSVLIFVYLPSLVKLFVIPDTAVVAPGETTQFSVLGTDSVENLVDVKASWTATGGDIDSSGLYTAGDTEGMFHVTATEPATGKVDTGIVIITLDSGVWNTRNNGVPHAFALSQNYPNPFNPETVIAFNVKESCKVTLKLYDVLGRDVRTIIHGNYAPGIYKTVLNAKNLPTGMYIYRIQMKEFVAVRKMVFMK